MNTYYANTQLRESLWQTSPHVQEQQTDFMSTRIHPSHLRPTTIYLPFSFFLANGVFFTFYLVKKLIHVQGMIKIMNLSLVEQQVFHGENL